MLIMQVPHPTLNQELQFLLNKCLKQHNTDDTRFFLSIKLVNISKLLSELAEEARCSSIGNLEQLNALENHLSRMIKYALKISDHILSTIQIRSKNSYKLILAEQTKTITILTLTKLISMLSEECSCDKPGSIVYDDGDSFEIKFRNMCSKYLFEASKAIKVLRGSSSEKEQQAAIQRSQTQDQLTGSPSFFLPQSFSRVSLESSSFSPSSFSFSLSDSLRLSSASQLLQSNRYNQRSPRNNPDNLSEKVESLSIAMNNKEAKDYLSSVDALEAALDSNCLPLYQSMLCQNLSSAYKSTWESIKSTCLLLVAENITKRDFKTAENIIRQLGLEINKTLALVYCGIILWTEHTEDLNLEYISEQIKNTFPVIYNAMTYNIPPSIQNKKLDTILENSDKNFDLSEVLPLNTISDKSRRSISDISYFDLPNLVTIYGLHTNMNFIFYLALGCPTLAYQSYLNELILKNHNVAVESYEMNQKVDKEVSQLAYENLTSVHIRTACIAFKELIRANSSQSLAIDIRCSSFIIDHLSQNTDNEFESRKNCDYLKKLFSALNDINCFDDIPAHNHQTLIKNAMRHLGKEEAYKKILELLCWAIMLKHSTKMREKLILDTNSDSYRDTLSYESSTSYLEAFDINHLDETVKPSLDELLSWQLVIDFSKVHGMDPPNQYLVRCASCGNWFLFLLFAQIYKYPQEIILKSLTFCKSSWKVDHLERIIRAASGGLSITTHGGIAQPNSSKCDSSQSIRRKFGTVLNPGNIVEDDSDDQVRKLIEYYLKATDFTEQEQIFEELKVSVKSLSNAKLATLIATEMIEEINDYIREHLSINSINELSTDFPGAQIAPISSEISKSNSQFFKIISLLGNVSILGQRLMDYVPPLVNSVTQNAINSQKTSTNENCTDSEVTSVLSGSSSYEHIPKLRLINELDDGTQDGQSSNNRTANDNVVVRMSIGCTDSEECEDMFTTASSLATQVSIEDMILTSLIYIKCHECFTLAYDMQSVILVLKKVKAFILGILAPNNQMNLITKLLTSIGRYSEMTYIFDLFRDRNQFEMLLGKSIDKTQELKVALFHYAKKNPEFYQLVTLSFSMFRAIAESLEDSADRKLKKLTGVAECKTGDISNYINQSFHDPNTSDKLSTYQSRLLRTSSTVEVPNQSSQSKDTRNKQQRKSLASRLSLTSVPSLRRISRKSTSSPSNAEPEVVKTASSYNLETLELCLTELVDASDSYSKAGCYKRANYCERQAKLVALQINLLASNINVLNLSRQDVVKFVSQSKSYTNSCIVAEAYDCQSLVTN